MTGKTHTVGGVALALTVTTLTGLYYPDGINVSLATTGVYLACAGTGALLPDIDTKRSTVSQEHKVVSFFSRLFLTHRGFTHSPLCLAILGIILYIAKTILKMPFLDIVFTGFLLGYGSHIILDSFNPKGVPLLYPSKKRFSFGNVKTSGFWENFVFFALTCVIAIEGYIIVENLGLIQR